MTVANGQRNTRKRRTSSAAPTANGAEGLRAQGVRTRNAIVCVARELLLESGPLEFSLRAVALNAGICVSNLRYYFLTRGAVLRAVMEPVIVGYLDDLRRALESTTSPRETFDALLERSVQDAKDSKSAAMWWHFFSFAATDPECSQLLEEWYDTLTSDIAQLIGAANPKREAADCMHIAVLLISMVDGLSVQLGTARNKHAYARGLEAKFIEVARYLVWGKSLEVTNV